MVDIVELSIGYIGIFLAMMMYTALYGKGNPLYSIAEESYIGVGTGLTVVTNLQYIWRVGIEGVLAGDYILIIGIIIGVMMWARISPQYSYITRLPVSMTVGTGLALSLRTVIFTGFINQLRPTIQLLFTGTILEEIMKLIVIISIVTQMTFFLYTTEVKGIIAASAKIGEYFLYAGFGAIFAQTFMGRLGLFVGFIQSNTIPQWKTPILLAASAICLIAVIALDRLNLLERLTPET